MTHDPSESQTDALLAEELPKLDRNRSATFVEIGCGTSNFSFLTAHKLGYYCCAIEPFIMPPLREAFESCMGQNRMMLVHAAVAASDGTTQMYLHTGGDSNFNSLLPDWIGAGRPMSVDCMSLKNLSPLLGRNGFPGNINVLKLDVEGAEVVILRQASKTCAAAPTQAIVLEYGGGGPRKSGIGGWTNEHFGNTLECMKILVANQYSRFVRIDSDARLRDVGWRDNTPWLEFFPMNCHYGNIIAFL